MNDRTIRARLIQYFKRSKYPIQFAYLFGSRARGQALPYSDTDVGVYLDEPNQAARFNIELALMGELEHALHTDHVDVVVLNAAPPRLAYNIIKYKPIYSRDERARARIETAILSRYFDERPANLEQYRYLHRRIRAGKMAERTPEMIDVELVNERLKYIEDMLSRLKRFRNTSQEEFYSDQDIKEMSAHELQTCIEAVTDICNHLVAAMGLEKPKERREAPLVLSKHGILPVALAEQLAEAVSMRNQIVHGYLDSNPGKLYTATHDDLSHLTEFSDIVSRFLEKQEKQDRTKRKKGAKQ